MRLERCREYLRVCDCVHREEQHVGQKEELERRSIELSLPLKVCHRQGTRTRHQTPNAANQSAIDPDERQGDLLQEAPKRQVPRVQWTLAASRAEGCRDGFVTGGAGPRLADG